MTPPILARVSGVVGGGDDIDFAAAGGVTGLISGIVGLVVGLVGIASGVIGIVGGVFGVITSGILGIVAGGVLGVTAGGALGASGMLRGRSFRGSFQASIACAVRGDAGSTASGVAATASWPVMRLAAGLMPRAAGRRWLEEAESFLSEAAAEDWRQAPHNYIATAPQVIILSWITVLTRRIRLTRGDK